MNTTSNVIVTALDDFTAALSSHGPRVAVIELAHRLAAERKGYDPEAWRAACAEVERHPALDVLAHDPYCRDARRKPSGYAGDARILDYVYLRDPGNQPVSPLGEELFSATTAVPGAVAVRDRCERLARMIVDRTTAPAGPHVVSVACGHARELDLIPATTAARVHYWGMDQDSASLEAARRRHPRATFESGAVRALIQGSLRLPPGDLVYASGLFDYLTDRVAAVVLKRMWAAVQPGGTLVVPNLTPRCEEAAFMEAVMDWWMEYRDESAMRRLADDLGFSGARAIETYETCDGRVAWLVVHRM